MTDRLVLHTRVVSGSGGGPDKTILNSPRFLKDRGYPMVCAYMRHPADQLFGELEKRAAKWQAPLVAVDDFGPFDWRLKQRFDGVCQRYQPAIWHGHDYKSNLLGFFARRRHPMTLVTTVHGWVKRTWKTPLYYAIDRYCLRGYDQVICVSEDLFERCQAIGVPEDRLWLVHNAIDTDDFRRKESSSAAKSRLGMPEGRLLIGSVGRLSDEKRFDLLIRAAATLIRQGAGLELWIAGEGDQAERLRELIGELGMEERIKLLGFRSDTVDLYHAMDVFCLSSVREGLPNVLLEAMALEVPVLATRIAGIPKLITDGVDGLLVEPADEAALTAALARLVEDANLRARLAAAGRATIENRYSFRRRMDKIKAIYDHALGIASLRPDELASKFP